MKKWTSNEERVLLTTHLSLAELAELLNRSAYSVRRKQERLKKQEEEQKLIKEKVFRTCSICGETKPMSNFHNRTKQCDKCRYITQKERLNKRREKGEIY